MFRYLTYFSFFEIQVDLFFWTFFKVGKGWIQCCNISKGRELRTFLTYMYVHVSLLVALFSYTPEASIFAIQSSIAPILDVKGLNLLSLSPGRGFLPYTPHSDPQHRSDI